MPRGVLGLNANMFNECLKFIANRRCQPIGIAEQYPGATNPFPWMSEMMDLKKEKNFFETRVIEYSGRFFVEYKNRRWELKARSFAWLHIRLSMRVRQTQSLGMQHQPLPRITNLV